MPTSAYSERQPKFTIKRKLAALSLYGKLMNDFTKRCRRFIVILASIAVLTGIIIWCWPHPNLLRPPAQLLHPPVPSLLAQWPWPHAVRDVPHAGVTHWMDNSSPDGTVLDFFDFNFTKNPHLKFEIYDQDEDDARPFDNFADCWPVGVGQATHHLNAVGRGKVVATWHGLFFDYEPPQGRSRIASAGFVGHPVTPVVLGGKVHSCVGQARWTFGVRYASPGHPQFKTLLMPDKESLARSFTFAAGGAQCLMINGKPQRLQPFSAARGLAPAHTLACAPDEAGFIPNVDWIQTSRATMGWSRDNTHFYLLFIKQTGTEGGAVAASHGDGPPTGGWTVSDEQHFWLSHGAWGAINSDGGDVAQLTYLLPNGNYVLLPPVSAGYSMQRLVFPPTFPHAPRGGTLLYFFLRDTQR